MNEYTIGSRNGASLSTWELLGGGCMEGEGVYFTGYFETNVRFRFFQETFLLRT